MTRFIVPIILIAIALSLFFVFTSPLFNDISILRTEVESYNQALDNSKMLENERDKLTAKYNSIIPENLTKLQKLLPENVDNIRLILEIEQVAAPYGMILKDVKYNTKEDTNSTVVTGAVVQGAGSLMQAPQNYGIFDLEFSTVGTYNNFINFTKDLESNLRIVDVSSVVFSSNVTGTGANANTSAPEVYKYDFKIKTYWLKN
jgi:Tfp pilus assembly protein PilO